MKKIAIPFLMSTLLGVVSAYGAPQSYLVDSRHTYPRFEVSHFGFSKHSGVFTKSTGNIVFDSAAKTGQVDIVIQAASINTGAEDLEKVLRSATFFDVEKYPQLTFRSQSLQFEGDRPSSVQGQLTMLGVTQPLTLTFENFNCGAHPVSKKEECGAHLTGTLKRSDYGMKSLLPGIGDDVKLTVQVEAYKE